jgi:ssDNA-binding Zn-finger/Zn-ribbon topoisomerase 1
MLKENGRLEPAAKEELANLKGKSMVCINCGECAFVAKVQFANTKCSKCGSELVDISMTTASKTTGS